MIMPIMDITAKSATAMAAMAPGRRVPRAWFGDDDELATGVDTIEFGITAIAGGMDCWDTFGGVESVEGIEQRFFSGFPQRLILPEKNSVL